MSPINAQCPRIEQQIVQWDLDVLPNLKVALRVAGVWRIFEVVLHVANQFCNTARRATGVCGHGRQKQSGAGGWVEGLRRDRDEWGRLWRGVKGRKVLRRR